MLKYLIVLTMALISSFASYFLKKSTKTDSFMKILLNYNFYIGGFLYVAALALNISLLQFFPFSVILPMGSITYVFTMILSKKLLGEQITVRKIWGIVFIIIGMICLGFASIS